MRKTVLARRRAADSTRVVRQGTPTTPGRFCASPEGLGFDDGSFRHSAALLQAPVRVPCGGTWNTKKQVKSALRRLQQTAFSYLYNSKSTIKPGRSRLNLIENHDLGDRHALARLRLRPTQPKESVFFAHFANPLRPLRSAVGCFPSIFNAIALTLRPRAAPHPARRRAAGPRRRRHGPGALRPPGCPW